MDIKTREEIVRKSATGTLIVFAATGLQYGLAFVTQVILARLLIPEYFGMVAFAVMIAMFVNNLCTIHGEKFIIKEETNIQQKFNNVFTLELLLSLFFLAFMLLLAPSIMKLLGKSDLTPLVQVLALVYLYNPFSKPKYLFERELNFKMSNIPFVTGQIVGSATGITMALLGFGVWSLVFLQLGKQITECILIWIVTPYKPRLSFNITILKQIINYGWPLMGSAILVFFYWNIDYYIVGHFLGEKQLGYYYLGFTMSHYLLKARNKITSVVFPAFSRMANDKDIKKGFELLTRYTAIIYALPAVIILALGEPTVRFIFGEKWLPAVVPFQIFMVVSTVRAFSGYGLPIIYAKGRTKINLYISIFNGISISLLGYYFTQLWGIIGMATAVLIVCITLFFITIIIINKLFFPVDFWHILKKPLLASIILGLLFFVARKFFMRMGVFTYCLSVATIVILYALFFRNEFVSLKRNLKTAVLG